MINNHYFSHLNERGVPTSSNSDSDLKFDNWSLIIAETSSGLIFDIIIYLVIY